MLLVLPLGFPARWRLIAMLPPDTADSEVTLELLQRIADDSTGARLRLRDPVWMTRFRLHNRGARRYRSGGCLLAGDAAHIHSPAGGQGMNTGVQDALNLGWKLALVCRGAAPESLLATYEAERAPVGRTVLRFTDRLFTFATGAGPGVRFARTRLVPVLAPPVLRVAWARRRMARRISELDIRYRRSPPRPPGSPCRAAARGPGTGCPTCRAASRRGSRGRATTCCWRGRRGRGPRRAGAGDAGRDGLVTVHRLGTRSPWPGTGPVHALVRPDGYLGYVARGTGLDGLRAYVERWLPL
ncbi:FAD-dependent monooxygenase [Streptomyces sp. M19]